MAPARLTLAESSATAAAAELVDAGDCALSVCRTEDGAAAADADELSSGEAVLSLTLFV